MKGLELARGYYEEYGRPMLEEAFPEVLPFLAAGFVGSGSDRFGFDDEISRDHDFEPGFSIYLPGEDIVDRRTAFLLERAYAKLPKSYRGVMREKLSPVGGNRNGVIRTSDFYREKTGTPDGKLSISEWLTVPDAALAEAVNGEVFFDGYGEFTEIRNRMLHMPEDIRLKRIAGNLLLAAQSGQYNFERCLKHGETEAAALACHEFVTASMKVFFLLNGRYMPYYKWSFRALKELPGGEEVSKKLSSVLTAGHEDHDAALRKQKTIEEVSAFFIERLKANDMTDSDSEDLERHAYEVNNRIADGHVRTLHILAGV